ncbi:PAS domain S-box protein [Aquibaculum arenosum]|uniref:histidine kinase n=1 Tax=Aquibaculum arenosum TaxID=3032591 RepID=A0ABT5YHD0_9PROT|nr:PAS domain S-box protein [Fodinicurvata sp. CAU 1616]MDF2094355.1 PAS domain S-box protein [Fodinicurvata sp. CAU 1616]
MSQDGGDKQGGRKGAKLPRLSLRSHIILSFVLLFGILAVALGLLTSRITQDMVDQTVSASFAGGADLAVQDLGRLKETASAAASSLAATPLARAMEQSEREARLSDLAAVLQAVPGVSAAYIGWPNGDFVLLRNAETEDPLLDPPPGATWLTQWSGEEGYRYEFRDASLTPLGDSQQLDIEFDPRTRPWFTEAQDSETTILTAPYVFFTTREPGISAGHRADSGAVAGVDLSLWDLSRRLPSGQPTPSSEAAVLGEDGNLLAYSDTGRLRAALQAQGAFETDSNRLPTAADAGSPVIAALAERWEEAPAPFFGSVSAQGETWLAEIKPLEEQRALFVMAAPISEISARPTALRARLLQVFGAVLIIGVAAVWLAGRRLAQPFERLTGDLDRIAALDFSPPPRPESRIEEIWRLEGAVHSMRTSLGSFASVYHAIAEQQDTQAMLGEVLDALIAADMASRGAVWLVEEGKDDAFELVAQRGLTSPEAAKETPDIARRIAEAASLATFAFSAHESGAGPLGERGRDTRVLGIPLHGEDGQLLGVLAIAASAAEAAFPAPVTAIAEFLGQSLALALERHRLIAERGAAQLETGQILNSVADGLHVVDRQGKTIRQNPAARAILGWGPEEVLDNFSHNLFHHHHPDGRPYPIEDCPVYHTLADGKTRRSEGEVFFHKDGRPIPVEFESSALYGADGEMIGAVVSFRDVSERIAAEARTRELQQQLERLIDQATVGILVHRDFVPILVNPALARMFGYESSAEILAMGDCKHLFAEHELGRLTAYNRARVLGQEAPALYRVEGRRRDGEKLVLDNRAFTIQWQGEVAVCSMLADITAQTETEEQLRQAQKLEAVGQLTGGVAHDFNNLLTVIMGNSELLAEQLADQPELQELATMVAGAAERGAELTGRLLAFARRQALAPRAVDINALIERMQGLLRRSLGETIEIQVIADPDLWEAEVDPSQLEVSVLNLAINSRDAMPKGGRLTIETRNLDSRGAGIDEDADLSPGRYVVLSVIDEGSGMPPEVAARAFEPFFTTKDAGEGSGLGLSMVYGFVNQSGGHARIDSEVGKGTRVTLYLPRAGEDALAEREAPLAPREGTQQHILAVEDDAMVRQNLIGQLRSLGYRVSVAENAQAALDVLEVSPDIDLLLTDVIMPGGMSGRELAEEARKRYPDLPILFTSGYVEDAMLSGGRLGLDIHFLPKPYRRQDLAQKVSDVLHAGTSR